MKVGHASIRPSKADPAVYLAQCPCGWGARERGYTAAQLRAEQHYGAGTCEQLRLAKSRPPEPVAARPAPTPPPPAPEPPRNAVPQIVWRTER